MKRKILLSLLLLSLMVSCTSPVYEMSVGLEGKYGILNQTRNYITNDKNLPTGYRLTWLSTLSEIDQGIVKYGSSRHWTLPGFKTGFFKTAAKIRSMMKVYIIYVTYDPRLEDREKQDRIASAKAIEHSIDVLDEDTI
jgi:hypothetical protein